MSKTCYIKCQSNKQAQELRPHLVAVGFWDSENWNDASIGRAETIIKIYPDTEFAIEHEVYEKSFGNYLLHTVAPDADLVETAKLIKELFQKQ